MARTTKMLTPEELAEVVSASKFASPDWPRVLDIKVEEDEDWEGEEILRVYIIFDDADLQEDWQIAKTRPVREAIPAALREAGETRFPLIIIGTPKDYAERNTYDPQSDD